MYMTLFMSELLRTSAGVIRITNPKPLQFPERQKGPVERDALFGQKKVPTSALFASTGLPASPKPVSPTPWSLWVKPDLAATIGIAD